MSISIKINSNCPVQSQDKSSLAQLLENQLSMYWAPPPLQLWAFHMTLFQHHHLPPAKLRCLAFHAGSHSYTPGLCLTILLEEMAFLPSLPPDPYITIARSTASIFSDLLSLFNWNLQPSGFNSSSISMEVASPDCAEQRMPWVDVYCCREQTYVLMVWIRMAYAHVFECLVTRE